MEVIVHPYLEVTKEDLKKIRQFYDLDDIHKIKESVDAIEEWLKKEDHLAEASKYINRDVIERLFIISRGSVEGTKAKLDKCLTIRALTPEICGGKSIEEVERFSESLLYVPLPKLNPTDVSRVMIAQMIPTGPDDLNLTTLIRCMFLYLRQQYDLDKPGRIEDAINALEEWIKKQNHFVKKEFPRDYLERTLIISKGSVEKAKKKLDRICTFRTKFPDFFGAYDVNNFKLLDDLYGVFLPKLTKDNYRVYLLKNRAKQFNTGFLEFYRYFFMQCEYIQAHDYCNGVILLIDYTEANILETVKWFNPVDLKDAIAIVQEGYGMRLKGLHLLSNSKAIETISAIFKQVLSAKLGGRIKVHKTVDTLNEYIPQHILPVEYGGKEKPMLKLHEQCKEVLTSNEFSDYLRDIHKACTNEKLRQNVTDDEHLGMQGTFRNLSVD